MSTRLEGQALGHQLHLYLCRCEWPPVSVLERRNGGEWAWRVVRAEHRL